MCFINLLAPKQSRVDKVFKEITLLVPPETDLDAINQGLQYGQAVATGMNLAKDLGNLPPNICTPMYLANTAYHWPNNTRYK